MNEINSTAFEEGVQAYWNGDTLFDNPYSPGTDSSKSWIQGFNSENADHWKDGPDG